MPPFLSPCVTSPGGENRFCLAILYCMYCSTIQYGLRSFVHVYCVLCLCLCLYCTCLRAFLAPLPCFLHVRSSMPAHVRGFRGASRSRKNVFTVGTYWLKSVVVLYIHSASTCTYVMIVVSTFCPTT